MNNTLTNGMKVLEFLADSAESYSVSELAEAMGLPNSHACRLLKTLTESGYVEQDRKTRKYTISLRILCLSNACLRRMKIRDRLRPFIKDLCALLGQDVYLQVPHHGEPLIIGVEYPARREFDSGMVIGKVNPVHTSAAGKLCAAYYSEEELNEFLTSFDFSQHTDITITDPETFRVEIESIRKEGISCTDSERGPGICAIAAPIFNCNGEFTAALGVVLPQGENSPEVWERFKEETKKAAEAASYALGYALDKLV